MINPVRHMSVFQPHRFNPQRIDVIGAGAGGSRVVMALAKLGCENIRVFDFDRVEEHNVANQIYGNSDIGAKKIDALQKIVSEQTGTTIDIVDCEVDGSQPLGPVVFLLTDTMKSRKEIFERGLKLKFGVSVVIEARMGADVTRNYAFDPRDLQSVKCWEQTLYTDEEAEVSLCGTAQSVGPTADVNAGFAVWQFVDWFDKGRVETHEIVYGLRPPQLFSRSFYDGKSTVSMAA